MTISPDSTVAEARAWLKPRLAAGERCPCCTQRAQTYRRAITAGAAAALVHAWRTHRFEWFHTPDDPIIAKLGGDWAKLAYFGIITDEGQRRPDGGRSGWWRITDTGAEYAKGNTTLPKYAVIYDGRLLDLEGPALTIHAALGRRFDLRELLGERGAA